MGLSGKKGNYFQYLGDQKFMGGQSIRGMLHRPSLGPLQVPKIPGTDHRWDTCLRPLQTVITTQSFTYWNTKGLSHKDIYRYHRFSQRITGPIENHSGCHTKALEKLTFLKDTAETFPERTLTQAQTATIPMQPRAICAMPRKHQWLTRANTPGLIRPHSKNR